MLQPFANQPRCAASVCSLGVPPRSSLGQRAGQNPGTPLQEFLVSTKLPSLYPLIKPKATGGLLRCILIAVTRKLLGSWGSQSVPGGRLASRCASGCAPGCLRGPPGGRLTLTQLLPWEVNLTGSPCPVFAGGGGHSAPLSGGQEKTTKLDHQRQSSNSPAPRNLGP